MGPSLTLGGICERGFGLWEGGFGTMYYHSEGSCTWGKSSRGPPRDHIPTARCWIASNQVDRCFTKPNPRYQNQTMWMLFIYDMLSFSCTLPGGNLAMAILFSRLSWPSGCGGWHVLARRTEHCPRLMAKGHMLKQSGWQLNRVMSPRFIYLEPTSHVSNLP